MTSLELRKLIVKLRNENKLSTEEISKTVGKSKSIIHSILRRPEETGACEGKKPPVRSRKTTAREDRWIGNESKQDRFATATAISKRANAKLGIKISSPIIFRRNNERSLNSRAASMKLYISKQTKWANWNLQLNTSYGLNDSGIVFLSMSQSLTSSVVTGEVSSDSVVRNDIHLSALKAALNLGLEMWWCFAWFLYWYRTSC